MKGLAMLNKFSLRNATKQTSLHYRISFSSVPICGKNQV